MDSEIITDHKDLVKMVRDGHFFHFCVAFALNKGYKDSIKEKKEVRFDVGDYEVSFDGGTMGFNIVHKTYFARIIHAYYNQAVFIGDDEQEVINDLLAELEKELSSGSQLKEDKEVGNG